MYLFCYRHRVLVGPLRIKTFIHADKIFDLSSGAALYSHFILAVGIISTLFGFQENLFARPVLERSGNHIFKSQIHFVFFGPIEHLIGRWLISISISVDVSRKQELFFFRSVSLLCGMAHKDYRFCAISSVCPIFLTLSRWISCIRANGSGLVC